MKRGNPYSPVSLKTFIFNIAELFHHHITAQEVELIKNTGLFAHLNPEQFNKMFKSVRLVKYPKNTLIFEESDLPDALYLIFEGTVRIFSYDTHGKKIALARLTKGDYFGEQALIGETGKTRSASAETIEDTTLIRIDAKTILPLWKENEELRLKLKKIGSDQTVHALTSSVQIYSDIENILKKFEQHTIKEYKSGEIIFKEGDKPDNVYIILSGKVEIAIPNIAKNKITNLILHKGHLFGELGVIENKPRAGTAKAHQHVRLFAIPDGHFKQIVQQHPELQNLLSVLKQTYQLPLHGMVEQYVGSNKDIGHTITNIFKIDDGRTLISVRSFTQNIFSMSVVNTAPGIDYKYEKNQITVKINVNNDRLVSIESCGEWDDLSNACRMMLDNEVVDHAIIENFQQTGKLGRKPAPEIVCNCMSVTKNQLQELIDKGMRSYELLSKETGAGTVCGSCQYKILSMLGESNWVSAVMKKAIRHNDYIASYFIQPTSGELNKFIPGQHLVVQVKARDNWVERSYTLSNVVSDTEPFRLTIKREPKGMFTTWLFDEAPDEIEVKVTQPQGSFTLNPDENTPAICFAGGIGCTPFISYLKALKATQNNKRVHLLYCALSNKDFIFTDEFADVTQAMPSVTVDYRPTDEQGLLSQDEVLKLIQGFSDADIYICGPEGFKNLLCQILKENNYHPDKIHFEVFFHAGSPSMSDAKQ